MRVDRDATTRPARHGTALVRFAPLAILILGLVAAYLTGLLDLLSLQALSERQAMLRSTVAENVMLAALGATLLYAVAIAFIFPAPVVLTLAAGLLFHWPVAFVIVVVGATLGSAALFLAARTALAGTLKRRAGGMIDRFAQGFMSDAFLYILMLRLTPVIPVAAVTIGAAALGTRLRTFVFATALGFIPGVAAYTYLGAGLAGILDSAAHPGDLTLADLGSTRLTVALAGLATLSLLGVVLKKLWLDPRLRRRAHTSAP
ncbi:TVP38/TMEM64 family protein [Mangrovicella endophytica]|uniref:TVP38/TMEM64 family protein n=1 Tax=Mangrovicella endophytica TaxID=2066697 RepID=UPI0012FFFB75|nr:VTT domain-containing protein [Mangrovicella endophytica]